MAKIRRGERRQEILQTLAHMLEETPGERITTASLAHAVGVSEAALYRHFPSKGKMFEALIEFIEESLFTRINLILVEVEDTESRVQQIIGLVLGFAEKNPGITRLMQGGVLVGETRRLRERVAQVFERLETQIRQVLREGELNQDLQRPVTESAKLLVAFLEGQIARYVRSGFRDSPLSGWSLLWGMLRDSIFRERTPASLSGR